MGEWEVCLGGGGSLIIELDHRVLYTNIMGRVTLTLYTFTTEVMIVEKKLSLYLLLIKCHKNIISISWDVCKKIFQRVKLLF